MKSKRVKAMLWIGAFKTEATMAESLEQSLQETLRASFKSYVRSDHHPCIMAKAAERFDRITLKRYRRMGCEQTTQALYSDIEAYAAKIQTAQASSSRSLRFESFVAVFDQSRFGSERKFEDLLWRQLEMLHEYDDVPWDPSVSQDPDCPDFSFSIAGFAFFIVGLHPDSCRKARRFFRPAIVFNLHYQFQDLKTAGKFETIQRKIRRLDKVHNGSFNPVLADYGQASEALQYSGREVEKNWKCPVKFGSSS